MKKQSLLSERRFILIASLMLAFSIIVAISRFLLAKQSETITLINDVATVLCALVANVFFIGVWLSTSDKDLSKKIWGQMAIGMIGWTVAEATWAYYEVILGQDVPYPSLADLFWLFGYVVFYVALANQYRLFQTSPTRQQRITITSLVIFFSVLGGFLVLKPIIESFDPQNLLASLLNIAYPLSDLVLFTLTLAIIFSLEQGRFAFTWRFLGLGLLFMASGDLIFSYASTNGMYAPDGQLNMITLLIDTIYYIAYLTLGLGAYTYSLISRSLQPVTIDIALNSLTKSNILIFIDADGKIISLSDNFSNLIRGKTTEPYIQTALSDALKIDPGVLKDLIQKTLQQGALSTQPMEIKDSQGEPREIWLTSLPIRDDHKQLVCLAIILRVNLDLQNEAEKLLTEEQKGLIQYYLTQAGTYRNEENQVLKTYFLQQIRLLYSLIQQFNGISVAEKLLTTLNQIANQNRWQFTFTNQEIGIPEEYEGEILADRLYSLLDAARSFAVNVINLKIVEQEIKILDNNISVDNLEYIDKYGLRAIKVAA